MRILDRVEQRLVATGREAQGGSQPASAQPPIQFD
jgi:hypothetical protein